MYSTEAVPMEKVLFTIEQFLLPTADDRYLPTNMRKQRDTSSSPKARLDHILYQVALADHIRTVQIMYRDSEDEQCLAPELREGDTSVKLPTNHLMEKLSEGRSRIVALCRCCYGKDSLEGLRASVDLASSYALQGMWLQVSEHVTAAINLLSLKEKATDIEREERRSKQERGKQAARLIHCCYTVLRTHALANKGQIGTTFMKELQSELSHFSYDVALGSECDSTEESSKAGTNHGTHLTTELVHFFNQNMRRVADGNLPSSEEKESSRYKKTGVSWGDLVNFLRMESAVMRSWMEELEGSLLPQNRAALHLPFRICDEQRRGIAHPTQLCATLMRFSSALKVIAGTSLLKKLKDLKIAMPTLIDRKTGNISSLNEADLTSKWSTNEVILRHNKDQLCQLDFFIWFIHD
jgi:hypothetical protein